MNPSPKSSDAGSPREIRPVAAGPPKPATISRGEQTVFDAARQMPDAPARSAYLDAACTGNLPLRERIEKLLKASVRADEFLAQHPLGALTASLAPSDGKREEGREVEVVGTIIGRYKLLEKIGEGGFGVVYMAEQKQPIKRRVALKIIKVGMDTREVVARFEAERQALALMDHPSIAKVFDAGMTETPQPPTLNPQLPPGRPYFVMELVRGIKITDYCDEQNLSTRERLDLFTQVCQAVQHAHQKGIIHRDLKPSNILVTVNDGVAVPKIIDFGIAKATQMELTEKTVFTRFHQFLGTPAYMSPEQAELTSVDVDTRSDIYSLGVLLYELLTGKTPFDANELLKAGLDEMRRTIREVEPVKPSTRLTQEHSRVHARKLPRPTRNERGEGGGRGAADELSGDDQSASSPRPSPPFHGGEGENSWQRQHSKSAIVNRQSAIPSDLDWIVMKCLEKDRARRYETANGLATDIQRHLNNEPVVARPPSNLYRFQKMVRRNKLAFAAGAVVILALSLGLGISTWALFKEQEARQRATTEATKSQQVDQFLEDMLQGVGPSVALGRDTKLLREILEKATHRLDSLTNQPAVEGRLRTILGMVYGELGEYTNAAAMHERGFELHKRLHGDMHQDVASSLYFLATVLAEQGNLTEAEKKHREALAMRMKLLGDDHRDVAASLNNLGVVLQQQDKLADAEALFREVLAIQRKLSSDQNADALHNLAFVLHRQGKFAEADPIYREALVKDRKLLGNEHPDVAMSLANLASLLADEGKLAEAEAMHREVLAMRKKLFGNEHPRVANSLNALGGTLWSQDKMAEAESMFREALVVERKFLGDEHPNIATSLNNLGQVLAGQGRLAEAEAMHREALAMERKLLGNEHSDVAGTLNNLGLLLHKQGNHLEAETLFREALEIHRKRSGEADVKICALLNNLARLLEDQGKLTESAALLREAVDLLRISGSDLDLARALPNLAGVLLDLSQSAEAQPLAEDAVALCRQHADWGIQPQCTAFSVLGTVLAERGQLVEAEAVHSELLTMLRKRAPDLGYIGGTTAELAVTLIAEHKFADAESVARECLEFRQRHYPDSWFAFSARVLLGESLLRREKYADAEPMLVSGFEGMESRKDKIPSTGYRRQPRLKKAMELLVQLYEASGRPGQAAAWKQKLAEFEKAEAQPRAADVN